MISLDILSRVIFARILLKIKLYKHHKVSLILCWIGFIIMIIFAFQSIFFGVNGYYNELNSWIYLIFLIVQKILWSIEDSISKILLKVVLIIFHFYKAFQYLK